MADTSEDKDSITARLEENRQKMAVQVHELKEDYNVQRRLENSVRDHPWSWVGGAALTGFLLSRIPARKKEVYLQPDPYGTRPPKEVRAPDQNQERGASPMAKVWSVARPIIAAYVSRELYQRVRRR
jgi:hypothetical protein